MPIVDLHPRLSLNGAYLKVKPNRTEIESFKTNFAELLSNVNIRETEEFNKNLVIKFLEKTYYSGLNFINTRDRSDLVIHAGAEPSTPVSVIIEIKNPTNKMEMIRRDKLNAKAFQELILYYLRERIKRNNIGIKHLIVTNVHEWFIFDAQLFETFFAEDKSLIKNFEEFEQRSLSGITTDFFYKNIAGPAILNFEHLVSIRNRNEFYTYFRLEDIKSILDNPHRSDDYDLIPFYKILSPEHLLKLPFKNDSNTLDKIFYTELLHIIGLVEIKEKSKRVIRRKELTVRDNASLLENTIIQLDGHDKISRFVNPSIYGNNLEEQYFNIALELVITWINRILFLKLLEAQLLAYHRDDKSYFFLNISRIKNFYDLDDLFFQVLSKPSSMRKGIAGKEFKNIPYLNSTLFEPTELEHTCIFINQLDAGSEIPILPNTVLKDDSGKRRTGTLPILEYLFLFLDAYDFSAETSEQIQEDNKTLISASVLGLIFEKINGYRDGSYFTPGYITMYMCQDTIRKAIISKFNNIKGWKCTSVTDLYNSINNRAEANEIIDSIRICDPSVGSGHFLVSALNEIIALKSELQILLDENGRIIRDYEIRVLNDELIVRREDGRLFEYNPRSIESTRLQKTLFNEKKKIIEGCLFGVDINPNSVKICRLRLWIELLKNSYYKSRGDLSDLETLPNIDINIKCGNSLIRRFDLDADISGALKKSKIGISVYRDAVKNYQHATGKDKKKEFYDVIGSIKTNFKREISLNDPKLRRLRGKKGDLEKLRGQHVLFELAKAEIRAKNMLMQKLSKEIEVLTIDIEQVRSSRIFENAFEWRFEFPEVLDEKGDFLGFDVVLGNPPYGINFNESEKLYFDKQYETTQYNYESYGFFYELGCKILKPGGILDFITPNTFLVLERGDILREFLFNRHSGKRLIEIFNVFSDAVVEPVMFQLVNEPAVSGDHLNVYLHRRGMPRNFESILELPANKFSFDDLSGSTGRVFNYRINEREKDLINAILLKSRPLSSFSMVTTGVKPYQVGKGNPPQTKQVVEKKPFTGYSRVNDSWKPLARGTQIGKFSVKWDGEFILYGEWLAEPRSPQVFADEKILIRRTDDRLLCAYDNTGMIGTNSVHSIQLRDTREMSYKYLLALLNSKLLQWIFQIQNFHMVGKPLAEVKVVFVERLPIALPVNLELIERLVDEICESGLSLSLARELDHCIYRCYNLTEDDIAMVESV